MEVSHQLRILEQNKEYTSINFISNKLHYEELHNLYSSPDIMVI
jgi:hypothetical protein